MLRRIVRGAIVVGCLAGSAWSGSVLARGSQAGPGSDVFALRPGCVLVVEVAGEHPRQAIDRLLVMGARVTTEYQTDGRVEVVSEELGLWEDDDRWGELLAYDHICDGDGEPV